MPTGQELLDVLGNMRADTTGTYKLLMHIFGPAIKTKKVMDNAIFNDVPWTETVTISDEAMIILLVLNFWNIWVPDHLKIGPTLSPANLPALPDNAKRTWPQDRAVWSTRGRCASAAKMQGWADESIAYYKILSLQVAANRNNAQRNQVFDMDLRAMAIEAMSKTNKEALARKNGGRLAPAAAPLPASAETNLEDLYADME